VWQWKEEENHPEEKEEAERNEYDGQRRVEIQTKQKEIPYAIEIPHLLWVMFGVACWHLVQDRREGHLALRKFGKTKQKRQWGKISAGETKDDSSIEQNKTRRLTTESIPLISCELIVIVLIYWLLLTGLEQIEIF
jgi:hypothetical protein